MGSAFGNAAVQAAHGSTWLDIRNLGASAGSFSTPSTNRAATQAAIDAAVAGKGQPFLPAGIWSIDRPIHLDQDGIGLFGESGTTIKSSGPFSPIVIGCRRKTVFGATLQASDFLDLRGLLDSSVAPTSGVKWGYSLAGGKNLLFVASPASQGIQRFWASGGFNGGIQALDAYKLTRTLTIEWPTRITANPWAVGPLMGLSDSIGANPGPWALSVIPSGALGGTAPTNSDGGPSLALTFTTSELGYASVIDGGAGYTSAPTVTISDPTGYGSGATATAVVSNGVVTGINLTNFGMGYTRPAPVVTISGGGGSGATAYVVTGRVRSFYAPIPATAPLGVARFCVQFSLATQTVAMWAGFGGTDPVQLPVSTVGAGAGWGSLVNPTFLCNEYSPFRVGAIGPTSHAPGSGMVQGYNPSNYTFPAGPIASLALMNGGSGYASAPTVTITGTGSGATAVATVAGGVVTGITLTNPGSGYMVSGQSCPLVTFSGGGGTGAAAAAIVGPLDRDVLGLRISSVARYTLGATGSAQSRIDGATLNDTKRYFTNEAWMLMYLPLDEPFATGANAQGLHDRSIPIVCNGGGSGGPGRGFGRWMDATHGQIGGQMDWVHNVEIRDVSVSCNGGGDYGCGIEIHSVIDPTIGGTTLKIVGGAYGLATVPNVTGYTGTLWGDITISSNDTSVLVGFGIWRQQGRLCGNNFGRWFIRGADGTDLTADYCLQVTQPAAVEGVMRMSGSIKVEFVGADWESPLDSACKAGMFLENPNGGIAAPVHWDFGTAGAANTNANAPWFLLDEHGTFPNVGVPPAIFRYNTSGSYTDCPAGLIRIHSRAAAIGRVLANQAYAAPFIVHASPDGRGKVIAEHHHYQGVPVRTSWATQAHEIVQDRWVDGGFEKFLCAVGGANNTPTPPNWIGVRAMDVSGSGLAGYIVGHSYATGGNTTPHQGGFTDYAQAQSLNGYFRGTAATPPTLTWGLATQDRGARLDGVMTLLSGATGYAPVTGATWAASSGGATSNTSTVNLGSTITGTGQVVNALVGYVGGTPWVQIPIKPVTLSSTPQAISFAPGTLQIAATPLPGQSVGSLATSVQDKLNDFVLRGVAIPSPGTISLALSTNAAGGAMAEPSGNGYARVAVPAWTPVRVNTVTNPIDGMVAGWTSNALPLTFPTPTGSWGTIRSVSLMDSAGNLVGSANLPIVRVVAPGSPALTAGPGAFWVSSS